MNIKSNVYVTGYVTQSKEVKFQVGFYLTKRTKEELVAQGAISEEELADVSGLCLAAGVPDTFVRKMQEAGLTRASEAEFHFGGVTIEDWKTDNKSGRSARIIGLAAVVINDKVIELEFSSVDEMIAEAIKKAEAKAQPQNSQVQMTIGA